MRHTLTPLWILLGSIFLYSCEQTTADQQVESMYFETISFTPRSIQYAPDTIQDTTITVAFQGVLQGASPTTEGVAFVSTSPTFNAPLDIVLQSDGSFEASSQLTLNTGESTTLRARIEFVQSDGQSTRYETSVPVKGVADAAPMIDSIIHPDSVRIPSSGSQAILFVAEISHSISLQNVASVTMELLDAETKDSRGVFSLADDGLDGDEQANDGRYFVGLSIGSDNQPASYILQWNATSVTGLSATQQTTTLDIIE
jgi:hypothetical protein